MACTPKQLLLWVSLLLLLTSFTVLGYSEDSTVSYAQAPHYFPGHPPVGAPAPHHHHHHHHPKHLLTPPPAKPPTPPPVNPPSPHHHHHHHPKHPISPPPSLPPTPPPHKPSTPPPAKPPSPPTTKPPSPAPVKPPVPIRKLVAVQGVVYCKSCKYTGINTLTAATPLANATVRLMCTNTKYHLVQDAKTDKNGYFFIMAQKVTTSGSHKCKVFLMSSPLTTCNVATDLHAGHKGAILMPSPPKSPPPIQQKFELFTVGPFAFEPPKKC